MKRTFISSDSLQTPLQKTDHAPVAGISLGNTGLSIDDRECINTDVISCYCRLVWQKYMFDVGDAQTRLPGRTGPHVSWTEALSFH